MANNKWSYTWNTCNLLARGGEAIMAMMYCVKCRAKREDANAQEVTMKNGKKALKGKCPVCSTGMYKIGGK